MLISSFKKVRTRRLLDNLYQLESLGKVKFGFPLRTVSLLLSCSLGPNSDNRIVIRVIKKFVFL
ncbi:RNA1 polyprotein [Gossypium arboreum]|uniref:RNA1 polyprotein n=1 Tax=Gossypium arboreum TaxID=29729 RepID=A0A0B0PEI8_GOSAR|nr:RNA1 polyprotein [Gossypium arboreum]